MPRRGRNRELLDLDVQGGEVVGAAHRFGRGVEVICVEQETRLQLSDRYGARS